jgi:iron(III) transport system ATP-binding protein
VGGQTLFDSRSRTDVPTNHRHIGMVFQSYAIWPHKTVYQNIAFPLRMQRMNKSEIRRRVDATAEIMELGLLLDRGASKLSGGQMQRVALARSIVMEPKVLLLDEPLSNLDAKLRDKLRLDLRELQTTLGITSIYVTHDQGEALALADRVAVMNKGKVVQLDEPETLYREPVNLLVADFLGVSNIFAGRLSGSGPADSVAFTLAGAPVTLTSGQPVDQAASEHRVCLRPEAIRLTPSGAGRPTTGVNRCSGTVRTVSFAGTHRRYRVALGVDAPTIEVVVPAGGPAAERGEQVELSIDPADVRILAC